MTPVWPENSALGIYDELNYDRGKAHQTLHRNTRHRPNKTNVISG